MSVSCIPQGKAVWGFPELPLPFSGFLPSHSALLSTTAPKVSGEWGASFSLDKEKEWLIC